jgi:hypothetical protein
VATVSSIFSIQSTGTNPVYFHFRDSLMMVLKTVVIKSTVKGLMDCWQFVNGFFSPLCGIVLIRAFAEILNGFNM